MASGSKPPALDATMPFTSRGPSSSTLAKGFDPASLLGARLKHFEIRELLGRGGMGAVFLGRDTSLDRPVAIKVLDPEIGIDAETISRFEREARAQAQLGHGNITQIYFIGEDRGVHFFAMEYVDGTPLDVLLARGERLSWEKALEVGVSAARGLKAALAKGFIHRDVKPSNLLVDKEGNVKIADFGLVKSLKGDAELTRQGVIVGSPLYMAPEQSRAEDVDHRSDIYSLGCTIYHLIAGQPPFNSPSPVAVMSMHVTDRATRLRALVPDVPEEIERLVDRMMAKDAKHRFSDYDALIAALEGARPGKRQHTGFLWRALALAIDLSLFAIATAIVGLWALIAIPPYFVLMNWLLGQTLGKLALRLQVTDLDGKRLDWKHALARFGVFAWGPVAWLMVAAIAYWINRDTRITFIPSQLKLEHLWQPILYIGLSALIFLAYLAGFLLAIFHPKRQALHDLVAKSEVTFKTRSLR